MRHLSTSVLLLATLVSPVLADEFKITFQGQDGLNRPPLLTVGFETLSDSTSRISASSELKNSAYADHPVEYKFFVNGELYKTLIELRDPTIVTPIVASIPFAVAQPPFPVTVVASLLYPKRPFTTVGTVVVMDTGDVVTFDCTLTDESGSEPKVYVANSVTTRPTTEGAIALEFEAKSSGGNENIKVAGRFTKVGNSRSGTLSYGDSNYLLSGNDESENLSELELNSTDGLINLSCS